MHPELTNVVYILLAVVFATVITCMIVYTRRLKTRKVTQEEKGRPPLTKEEGILLATRKNEGRTGTPS